MTTNGYEISFGGAEKLTMVMIAQLCEYTKFTDLYALKGQILWCVNNISIKLLFKKKTS